MWGEDAQVVPAESKKKKTNAFAKFMFEHKRKNDLDMATATVEAGELWGVS